MYDVHYANGLWVAVAEIEVDHGIFHSLDGNTWVATNSVPSGVAELHGVAHGNGRWVAVGIATRTPPLEAIVLHSSDGDTWVAAVMFPDETVGLNGIAFRP